MTDLMQVNNLTMTSKQIAEMVGSRHDKVKQSIKRLSEEKLDDQGFKIKDRVISEPPMGDGEKSGNGVVEKVYIFSGEQGKRDSIIVVAQMCPEFTARLVDRWQELENSLPKLPDFSDPVAAARAWADEVEQKQIAQQQLAIAAPKAEFYDAVTQSDDAISIAEVAKTLNVKGLGQNKLFKLLRDKGVLQTGGAKHNQPYQKHVDAGHFRLVETSWVAGNGDVRINMKTVVLQKGLDYIRKLVEKEL